MQEKRTQQLQSFCQGLGIHMHDLELLDMALTHTSYAHQAKQYPKPHHNERIEFLGDSVLSVIVSTYMYKNFPDLAEGQLTKLRAYLVCEGHRHHRPRFPGKAHGSQLPVSPAG